MPTIIELPAEQATEQEAPCTCTTPDHAENALPLFTPECDAQPECPFAVEEHDVELLCGAER